MQGIHTSLLCALPVSFSWLQRWNFLHRGTERYTAVAQASIASAWRHPKEPVSMMIKRQPEYSTEHTHLPVVTGMKTIACSKLQGKNHKMAGDTIPTGNSTFLILQPLSRFPARFGSSDLHPSCDRMRGATGHLILAFGLLRYHISPPLYSHPSLSAAHIYYLEI